MPDPTPPARSAAEIAAHDRGTFVHPEDGQTYRHPSSLESAHHVGPDSAIVDSPAQKAARAAAARLDTAPPADGPPPAYLGWENAPQPLPGAEPELAAPDAATPPPDEALATEPVPAPAD